MCGIGLEENQRDKSEALFLEMPHCQCLCGTKDNSVLENTHIHNSEFKYGQESLILNMNIFRSSLISLIYVFSFSLEWYVINLHQNESRMILWISIMLKFKLVRNNLL